MSENNKKWKQNETQQNTTMEKCIYEQKQTSTANKRQDNKQNGIYKTSHKSNKRFWRG